jgi:hypothetical protein
MEDIATGFFSELVGRAQPRTHDLALDAMGLGASDLAALDAEFSDDEGWSAVRAMSSNKSPGPDGFTWEFFRHYWATIKADVCTAVHAVFSGRDQAF